ncbi:HlyD family secretion protein [Sporosalibacterium faouarense]|uniref:HlyD family secretion protein n=1 Tax=Sporosalibacterium faouarense TaxID=516123 RepID=UPI00192B9B75|nr:HlyD family efflux transporter periplasmic adaptor subunit [Sporosalibacterium faouarense]
MKDKRIMKFGFIIASIIIIGWVTYANVIATDKNEDSIEGSGIVEGNSIVVSSQLHGQLKTIEIEEGELVEKEQLIATLDSEIIKSKVIQAEAQLEIAKTQVESAKASMEALALTVDQSELAVDLSQKEVENNIKQAKSNLEVAKSNLVQLQFTYNDTKNDYEKYLNLYNDGAVSKSQLEKVKLKLDTVKSKLEVAQKQVEGAVATLSLAKSSILNTEIYEKTNQSTIKQMEQAKALYSTAIAKRKLAEASLQEINAVLKDTRILAPAKGRITLKMVNEGELVNVGTPIVEVIDLSNLDLMVYISEQQIGRVKLEQEAKVYIDSFNDKVFKGKVSYISDKPEFTPKNVHMKEDRVKLVYGVKIKLEDTDGIIKPGMPADAIIE